MTGGSVGSAERGRYVPRPPLLGWPRQVQFEGGYGWLTPNGPAIVTQTTGTRATVATANGLCDFLDMMVAADVPARMPGLVVLHDWRSLQEIEAGAREVWGRRTRRADNPFSEADIYVALAGSAMLRMALRTAALTIQLAIGQRAARFVDRLDPVMAERRVQPPPPLYLERLRLDDGSMPSGQGQGRLSSSEKASK